MRSIEELGRVAPLASELNLGLGRYCYCRLDKNDRPQHVTLIHGPVIRHNRYTFAPTLQNGIEISANDLAPFR